MARYLAVLFLVATAFGLTTAATATKGPPKKVASYIAECEPKVVFGASKSEADCSEKCKKDANCRYAVYRKSQCGLVPAAADCVFKMSDDILLGFAYKKFIKKPHSLPLDRENAVLETTKGVIVLDNGRVTEDEECQALCDFHPTCKAAFVISFFGNKGCRLHQKPKATEAGNDAASNRGTQTTYIVA